MKAWTLSIILLTLHLTATGQNNNSPDIGLGTVLFNSKSTKLTKEAKRILDSVTHQIQINSTLFVRVVSFNKDFCDHCGVRSMKRATAVLTYLSEHGVSNDRLSFTNRLEGELNKVELFLTSDVIEDNPHPTILKRQNK